MLWEETTLGEIGDRVAGLVQTGPFGSQLHESDYSAEGIPVVMPKDIIDGQINTTGIARVGLDHVERLSRHRLRKGDIVYGRRGDIGRHALIRQKQEGWLCGTGCLRISLGDEVVAPLFLHYYLNQDSVIGWIANQAIGATLPNLNTSILRSVPIRLPPLPVQRRIASILSAYDDLIANNQRRIRILEDMARNLYREWFVKFRFPGHEMVKLVDSPLGKIPEGWEVKKLGDLCGELRKTVEPSELPTETPYIGLEHMPRRSIALGDWGDLRDVQSTKLLFNRGDVLFGKIRPYFHKVGVALTDGACSTDAIVIRVRKTESFAVVLGCVSSDEFVAHATQTSQGTKMPRANWDLLTRYPVCIPHEEIHRLFNSFMGSTVEQIRNLTLRNRVLRRTRDLLLPRLVSGEVDVSGLEVPVAESAG